MFKNTKNDYIDWLVIFGAIILVLGDIIFQQMGLFSLFLSLEA